MLPFLLIAAFSLNSKAQIKDVVQYGCTICQGLVEGIVVHLQQGYDQDDLEISLLEECNILARDDLEPYLKTCQDICTTYLPLFLSLIDVDDYDSTALCTRLGYCKAIEASQRIRRRIRQI